MWESRRGRVISWSPEKPDNDKKAFLASHPELTIRFVKEASVTKRTLVADKDFMDVGPRQENLTSIAGFPIMLQAPLQPCYGLTTGHRQKFASEKWIGHAIYLRTRVLHQDSQDSGDRAPEILAA